MYLYPGSCAVQGKPSTTIHAGLFTEQEFYLMTYIAEFLLGKKPSMNYIPWPWFSLCSTAHYLDTSTSQGDYIITFLGLWELCFAEKTIFTSWPSFLLVSKMSEVQDTDVIDQVIDQEIINLELKIADLQQAIEATLNNR